MCADSEPRENPIEPDAAKAETVLAQALWRYQDSSASGDASAVETLVRSSPEMADALRSEIETLENLRRYLYDEPPRRKFGEFEVIELLGTGSMGLVYKAWQGSLQRHVALKVLPPARAVDARYVDRFRREALIAGRLRHANIIAVYATGVEDGILYYAMELATGVTLSHLIRQLAARYGPPRTELSWTIEDTSLPHLEELELPPQDRSLDVQQGEKTAEEVFDLAYWRQVAAAFAGAAEALQHAHSQGVIHRDIKPSNLILERDGRLRILDFGIAHLEDGFGGTRSDERIGTLLYMSPEQVRGESKEVGPASDVYSLGATLYELLAWRPPFDGRTASEIADRIVRSDPVPPSKINRSVPRDLELIVLKCLRKEAPRRYGTAEALAQDLQRFARGDPVEAEPESRVEQVLRKLRQSRQRIVRGAIAVAAVAALAVLGLGRYSAWQEERRAEYERTVREAVMHTLGAQLLSLGPSANIVPGEPVRLLRKGELPSPGSRLDGVSNVSYAARNVVFLSGPRIGAASEDPLRTAADLLRRAVERFPRDPVGRYHLARALFAQRDLVGAERELRRVLQLDPNFLPAKYLLASIVETSSPEEAAALREEAQRAALESRRWSPEWLEAQRAALERRWKSAAAAFDALPADDVGGERNYIGYSVETFLTRGVARLKTGASVMAIADFAAASRDLPGWLEPKVLLARALAAAGQVAAAAREYEKLWQEARARGSRPADEAALAIARDCCDREKYEDALAWTGRVSDASARERELLRAEILSLKGDLRAAWDAARRALEGPPSAAVFLCLGNVAFLRRDFAEARGWYYRALEADRSDPRPQVALAACREQEGKLEEAALELEAAIRTHPLFAPAQYDYARVLAALGRLEDAARACERAIELSPGDALAYNNLGILRDRLGDLSAAQACFQRAIEIAPDFAFAHYNLGWAYHRQQLIREATAEYETAMALGIDDPVLRSLLGSCLARFEENERAAQLFQEAIQAGLEDSATYHDLGIMYLRLGKYPEAAKAFEKSLELEPLGDHAYWKLVWAFKLDGRYEEAAAACRRGIQATPHYVKLYEELADICFHVNRVPAGDELRRDVLIFERGAAFSGVDRTVHWILDDYRRAYWPRCASYASADHLIDGAELLVRDGDRWFYRRGSAAPPAPEWTRASDLAEGWEAGTAPFGYPAAPGLGTVLDDMKDAYRSVYLRCAFRVEDPRAVTQLRLRVQTDGELVAYLNGEAVVADSKFGRFRPEEAAIDPALLVAGENLLAIRWSNSALDAPEAFLRVQLERIPPSETEVSRRTLAALEALRESTRDEDGLVLSYLEGRLAEARGALAEAESRYAEAVARDPESVVPRVRLARLYRRMGAPERAEALVLDALRASRERADHALWEEWLETSLVDLRRSASAVLEAFRGLVTLPELRPGFLRDIGWLLERLSRDESLRINCGGKDCRVAGVDWSEDRFFVAGQTHTHVGIGVDTPGVLACVDATERYFYGDARDRPGYRIPLPPGEYQVVLRFTEGFLREPGIRRFDVLLEGETVLQDFGALEAGGFQVPVERTFVQEVTDGYLNIDFRAIGENPHITAIQIQRVERS